MRPLLEWDQVAILFKTVRLRIVNSHLGFRAGGTTAKQRVGFDDVSL